ncbi:MAG: Kelch repeat-containing protein, partial [Polyangiales bacterium]
PVRLEREGRDGATIALAAAGVEPAFPTFVRGIPVFTRARPSTDVLHVVDGDRYEELRVLHDDAAPSDLRWNLTLGPAIAELRVRDGLVEALDATGFVLLVQHRAFVEDANGKRRPIDFAIEGKGAHRTLIGSFDRSGLATPIVVDPVWTAVAPTKFPHDAAAALAIAGGKVLIASGQDLSGAGIVSSSAAEIYDPATNTWSDAGTLPFKMARSNTIAPLPGGKALMAGGRTPGPFDPDARKDVVRWDGAKAWTVATSLQTARFDHVLVALADGRVLAAGGRTGSEGTDSVALSTAEVYDPAANTWTYTSPMKELRSSASFVRLASGKVIVAGGESGGTQRDMPGNTTLSTAEIFDPATNAWTKVATMPEARIDGRSVLLPSGKWMVVGGQHFNGVATSDDLPDRTIYDPVANTWSAIETLPLTGGPFPVSLTDGRTLFCGNPTPTVYDPVTDVFRLSVRMPVTPGFIHVAWAPLPGAAMLAVGGRSVSGWSTTSAEVWREVAVGGACTDDLECGTHACVDGVCCKSATCAVGSVCNGVSSPGTCTKSNGGACTADADCASAHCVDGVCCNTTCTGQCQACDDPFNLGTCTTIAGAPHGLRTKCSDGGGNPCLATACNGTDAAACHAPPAGTVACGVASCVDGIEHHVGTCTVASTCSDAGKACGRYACGATTCNTSCTTVADCAAGFYCDAPTSSCVPVLGLGKSCPDSTACGASLSCVDGVCCSTSKCADGASCAVAGFEGTCIKKNGASCSLGAECGSGVCADGVCCNVACDKQCEACDNAGSIGTCTATRGKAHGARTACASDASDPCKGTACDGTVRDSCVGRAGADTVCRASSCSDAMLTQAAVCDGMGGCPVATTAACSGYVCESATACRTTCKDSGDCAIGFTCSAGACKPVTDTCSADGSQSIPSGGTPVDCAPFKCRAGACLGSCATSDECASGKVCSFADKTCVDPMSSSETEQSSGCSTSARTCGSSLPWLLVLAVVALRRRAVALAMAASGAAACSPATRENAHTEPSALQVVRASDAFRAFGALRASSVALPEIAGAPLHLEASSDQWIDVAPVGIAGHVRGRREEGAAVFAGVAPRTTMMIAEVPGGAEDLRLLETSEAPKRFVFRISHGPGIDSIRVREGRIEAVDLRGRVSLSTSPLFAVDAHGTRRTLSVRTVDSTDVEAILDDRGLAYPIVVDPIWSKVASMATPRAYHPAALLPDGRVLVSGGVSSITDSAAAAYSSAEIYDPVANTWSATGSMSVGRTKHTLTVVSGAVYAIGGDPSASSPSHSSAEKWSPSTGVWTSVAAMPAGRASHATAVVGGRLLVYGGARDAGTATPSFPVQTYLFDPAAGSWASAGNLVTDRGGFATVTLGDGRPMLVGGQSDASTASCVDTTFGGPPYTTKCVETWSAGVWTLAAPLSVPRTTPGATLLSGGTKVLVAGGSPGFNPSYSTTEIYDATKNTWSAGGFLHEGRDSHTQATLPGSGGKILLLGGAFRQNLQVRSFDIFDPVANKSVAYGKEQTHQDTMPSVELPSGLLVIGGVITTSDGLSGNVVSGFTQIFAAEPLGTACTFDGECGSGHCLSGICCSTASCPSGSTCSGAASPGTCAKNNALACASDGECASGHCVDGVCCESACTSQCAACDVPGLVGKCRPLVGAPHGARTSCTATPTSCGLACDGVDLAACHPRASGTPCGAVACTMGKETHASTCDGSGACLDVPVGCAGYACGATACKTTCATSADCAAGYACAAPSCVALPGKGGDCSSTKSCGEGLFCVDGVCCGSAACPADSTCAAPKGDCVKKRGASCAMDAECGSSHCVDGVCCDGACDGACQACDVDGARGTCTTVTGAPHGTRTCGGTDTCAAGACDGSDGKACKVFAPSSTSCRVATCVDGTATAAASCDGKGSCPAPLTSKCEPFGCNADGTACRTRCVAASDCAKNAYCTAEGKCVPIAGTCAADGVTLDLASGGSVSCAPFVCRGDTCVTSCTSTSDCASGGTCDTSNGTCTQVAAAPDSGGCSTGRAPHGGLALALALLAVARRRSQRL